MATTNPFHLLGDDDNDDPSHLIAVHQMKIVSKNPAPSASSSAPAKLPTKPPPPTQAVMKVRVNYAPSRGGARGRSGRGRGGGLGGGFGPNRDFVNGNVEDFGGSYNHGGRGGYRRSDHGNWGTPTDNVIPQRSSKDVNVEDTTTSRSPEKQVGTSKDNTEEGVAKNHPKENEEHIIKEMTLEEYEKIQEENRKTLVSMKMKKLRKVELDKELKSMQKLSTKKGDNDDIFIKLGSGKDSKKHRDHEKVKKSVSINEFLKPAEGERYHNPRVHGRGRGRYGGFGRGGGHSMRTNMELAIKIEDPEQFPTLGGGK